MPRALWGSLGGWALSRERGTQDLGKFHLTECINLMVLESQLSHKIVNLLFTTTDEKIQ